MLYSFYFIFFGLIYLLFVFALNMSSKDILLLSLYILISGLIYALLFSFSTQLNIIIFGFSIILLMDITLFLCIHKHGIKFSDSLYEKGGIRYLIEKVKTIKKENDK